MTKSRNVKSEEEFLAEFPPEEHDAVRASVATSLAAHRNFQKTGQAEGITLEELERRVRLKRKNGR